MCVHENPRRRWPWGLIAKIVIFVVVLGFALAALKISPTVGGGLFVSLAIAAAIKAGTALVADRRYS
ncbi:MAG TPA: hypothetical protein VG497_30305 [Kribbella sp.]|nr:hypothetical protein [Kribbella sp.]